MKSTGYSSVIIETENIDNFHAKRMCIFRLESSMLNTSKQMTQRGGHAGKNGYCIPISNELFAWFKSTELKSFEGATYSRNQCLCR